MDNYVDDIEDTIDYWKDERTTALEVLESMEFAGNQWRDVRAAMESCLKRGQRRSRLWLETERELTGYQSKE